MDTQLPADRTSVIVAVDASNAGTTVTTRFTDPPDDPPPSPDPPPPDDERDELPDTGADLVGPLAAGAAFLLAGVLLYLRSRKRT